MNKFEKIDVLVNSAGVLSRYRILEMREEEWDRVMNINLKGVFLCSKSVAPYMVKERRGKIINIGSASSRGPVLNLPQGGPDYCVSKSGVHALKRVLAWELAPYGINVNTVAPGPVETPMHKGEMKMIRDNYITGQTIHVNGGMLMVD